MKRTCIGCGDFRGIQWRREKESLTACVPAGQETPYELARRIDLYLCSGEGMRTLRLRKRDDEYIVMAGTCGGTLPKWLGLDRRIIVSLRETNGEILLSLSKPQVKDKLLIMAASLVICWPLLPCAAAALAAQLGLHARVMRRLQEAADGSRDLLQRKSVI